METCLQSCATPMNNVFTLKPQGIHCKLVEGVNPSVNQPAYQSFSQSVSQSVTGLSPAFPPHTIGGSSVLMVTGMCSRSQGRT